MYLEKAISTTVFVVAFKGHKHPNREPSVTYDSINSSRKCFCGGYKQRACGVSVSPPDSPTIRQASSSKRAILYNVQLSREL